MAHNDKYPRGTRALILIALTLGAWLIVVVAYKAVVALFTGPRRT